jgi:hypothetical protein
MTYDRFTVWRVAFLFGLFGCPIGCGSSDWGYVEGIVTLEGQPVGPGTLIFEPAGPDRRSEPSAVGHLNAQGEYTLSAGEKIGASVGEYRVTIIGGDSASFAEEMKMPEEARSLIPARYQSSEAGLTANVAPGKQTIDFELKKQNKRRKR